MEIYTSLVFLLFLLSTTVAVSVEVLKPIKEGTEAAVLLAPGEQIKTEAYKPLARTLQSTAPLKLWIVLMQNFTNGKVHAFQLDESISMAMKQINQMGFKSGNVFLAGHGQGGLMSAAYGLNAKISLKGVLLFAAYVTKDHSLKDYPVPVLTVSGDLDGLTRITKIVDTFEDLEACLKSSPEAMYTTPVIVVPGITHAQFASGQMPLNVVEHDLIPETDNKSAQKLISEYSSAFMLKVLGVTEYVTHSMLLLETGYNTTKDMLTPLSTIKALDGSKDKVSKWSITAQSMVINSTDKSLVQATNKIVNEILLEMCFPNLKSRNERASISTYTSVIVPPKSEDLPIDPVSPIQLKTKMKSQEMVKKSFPSYKYGRSYTCQDVNRQAFRFAFATSSNLAKHRYNSRGRPIRFNEDTLTSVGPIWSIQNIQLDYEISGLNVTSARLHTETNVTIPEFAGATYCTLLSPYRAMEWIYIDSLKFTNS